MNVFALFCADATACCRRPLGSVELPEATVDMVVFQRITCVCARECEFTFEEKTSFFSIFNSHSFDWSDARSHYFNLAAPLLTF